MERTLLFEAGVTGCTTYRIPALHVTQGGTALAFAEGRSAGSDWAPMELVCRRRVPGAPWGEPFPIAASRNGPVHNPVPFQGAQGPEHVHLIFGRDYTRFYIVSSPDSGASWSTPRELTDVFMAFGNRVPVKAIAAGPGGAVRMASGRVVVPIWLGAGTEDNRHGPCRTGAIYSEDDGQTWHPGGLVEGDLEDPSEAQIATLPGDRLLISVRNRNETRRRAQAVSADGGESWQPPTLARDIADPVCQGSIITLGDGRLLYTGPQSALLTPGIHTRRNVCLLLSQDEGLSWHNALCLEAGPSGYSALAQSPDGSVLCLVETWPENNANQMSLALHRVPLDRL